MNLPETIAIETTTLCNLKCEYCVLRENIGFSSTMSLDNFCLLKPYFKSFKMILLSGLAEPLMNKNIAAFIRIVKKENKHCSIRIISNASLLSEKVINELIDSGLDSFGFSIDSIDPQTNDKIRNGSNILNILENIALLNKIKKEKKVDTPLITATTVLQKSNYRGLPGVINKIAELGIETLVINGLEPYKSKLAVNVLWGEGNAPDDLYDILVQSLEFAEKHHITIRMNDFLPAKPNCSSVLMPIVLPNGDVSACSVLAYPRKSFYQVDENCSIRKKTGENKKKIFGNVFQESLDDIWNSTAYTDFRNRVVEKKFPMECRNCLMKHGVICTTNATSPKKIISKLKTGIY